MHGIQYGRVPIGVVFPQESIFRIECGSAVGHHLRMRGQPSQEDEGIRRFEPESESLHAGRRVANGAERGHQNL